MIDKESHEPGDADFERFIRENSHTCIPFPLIVLMEKIKAIQAMYAITLDACVKLDAENAIFKNKLIANLEKCATAAHETFDQFNFLLIDDEDDDDGEEKLSDDQN